MTRLSTWKRENSDVLVGGWAFLGPASAEVMSLAGLDWLILDAQHGSFNDQTVLDALHVIPPERVDLFVRAPRNDEAWIGRSLDAGARGVIIPMVETAEDARRAAAACRYPADGARSWGQMGPRWGRAEIDPEKANAEVVCAVMVESRTGLANLDEIAATAGVDMIFVGPFDLSIALGTNVTALLEQGEYGELGQVIDACRRHDVIPGAFAGTGARAARLAQIGFVALAAGTDAALLEDAARALTAGGPAELTGSY